MALSVAVVLSASALAWLMYVRSPELPARVAAAMGPLYQASLNKFYFDEIFWAILVAPLRGLAWLSSWFDRGIIDPIVDGVAMVPRLLERRAACCFTTGGAVVRAGDVGRADRVCVVCDASVAVLELR